MTRTQLSRIFSKALLGVAAAPLALLPGCRDIVDEVIPSRDGGGRDAGSLDGGGDAGLGDGGRTLSPQLTCQTNLDGGTFTFSECTSMCAGVILGNQLVSCEPSGDILLCSVFCGVGRLAEGVEAVSEGTGLGRVLADMAAHEAAAVIAFEQLARELEAHGLHPALGRGALSSAWEEQEHVRHIGGLATQHGGRFAVLRHPRPEVRSIEALALDNAFEGCVRETFGSLLGSYQARHALHPGVRRAMAAVSADEVGHGAWSWELADELEGRLPVVKRRQLREAREQALQTLCSGVLTAVPREHHALLGLPDEERLQTLAESMREQLL